MTAKTLPLFAAAALLTAGTSQAATIVYDFTGGSKVGVSDFGAGVTAGDHSMTGKAANGTYQDDRATDFLGSTVTVHTFAITVDAATTIDLSNLSFEFGYDEISGVGTGTYTNDFASPWALSISTGSGTPASGTHTVGATEFESINVSSNLTGLTGLNDTTVTFTLTDTTGANNAQRYTFFDSITVTGAEAVPEPGSLALLGLGGLCMMRRRRG